MRATLPLPAANVRSIERDGVDPVLRVHRLLGAHGRDFEQYQIATGPIDLKISLVMGLDHDTA